MLIQYVPEKQNYMVKTYTEVEVLIIEAIMRRENLEDADDAIKYIRKHHPHLLTT